MFHINSPGFARRFLLLSKRQGISVIPMAADRPAGRSPIFCRVLRLTTAFFARSLPIKSPFDPLDNLRKEREFRMPTATPTAIDPRKIAQTAIKNLTQLSTLPEVTTRIIAAVENPRSSAGQLHKIISYDPALVTRILKIVNSA